MGEAALSSWTSVLAASNRLATIVVCIVHAPVRLASAAASSASASASASSVARLAVHARRGADSTLLVLWHRRRRVDGPRSLSRVADRELGVVVVVTVAGGVDVERYHQGARRTAPPNLRCLRPSRAVSWVAAVQRPGAVLRAEPRASRYRRCCCPWRSMLHGHALPASCRSSRQASVP